MPMDDALARPKTEELSAVYDHLFRSSLPLTKLKDAAFAGRLFQQPNNFDGVAGRSMAWKLFLISSEPLPPPIDAIVKRSPLDALHKLRKEYVELLKEKMRAPDGSYEEGFTIPGVSSLPRGHHQSSANLQQNNPLSLSENNPWRDWFSAVELRNTIRQDVERTFPDIAYFRSPDVQAQLTSILYIQSVTHPNIGYRQGMHELLAPILYTLDLDSLIDSDGADPDIKDLCSHKWIAADAWSLFTTVMHGIGIWYEWRELPPITLPTPLKAQYRHGVQDHPADLKPYVAPIVQACQHLQDDLLKATDPVLWQSMQTSGIEPQIYGIRWLRLLFTREFSLSDALVIWDGIFSSEAGFELVPWICVAMLIRIRNQLIPGDYSEKLTCLLRYPPLPSNVDPSCPHHAVLLLKQALALHTSPNASTGASTMVENRNLLNISISVPEAQPVYDRVRARPNDRVRNVSNADARANGSGIGSSSAVQSRHHKEESAVTPYMANMELFARGLLEKSESLGINKSVMNAVAELRKNFPDLPIPLKSPSSASSSLVSYPLLDERPPEERPPWEPKTRFEIEKDMAQLRALHKKLSESVTYIVDVLLQDEGEPNDEVRVKAVQERKREAIESLAYVRDVLGGSVCEVEDERLFGEGEYQRRAEKARKEAEEKEVAAQQKSQLGSPQAPPLALASGPTAPNRVVAMDSQQRPALVTRNMSDQTSQLSPTARSPESLPFFGQAATLPRRLSSSISSGPRPPVPAPWHSTRSNFSASSLDTALLPRLPPPTSSNLPSNVHGLPSRPMAANLVSGQAPRQKKISHDPLGALPEA